MFSEKLVDMLVEERRRGGPDATDGLVIAATGNGSLHADLEEAALRAFDAGICVWGGSRCLNWKIIPTSRDKIQDARLLASR